MRWVLALAAFLALCAPARACQPAAPYFERLAASGLPAETLAGEEMGRVLDGLREFVAFDEHPTRIVVIFGETRAVIWLIVGDQLCNSLTGPAAGVREIVAQAKGQNT